ncbi:ATPase, partial [candidate division KSB1 bacterium 4484_87]
DISQLGFRIPAETLRRLWQMCAHQHGQLLNLSNLGLAMGLSHTTIRSYIELLSQTFMLRILPPYSANIKKRLVKSPKIYLRDTGILHALLGIHDMDELLGHPIYGASWESLMIENILQKYSSWNFGFYRTAAGAELDLILERAGKKIGIEFKASPSPKLTKGFWNALEDLQLNSAFIIAPVKGSFPIHKNVWVMSLTDFLEKNIF